MPFDDDELQCELKFVVCPSFCVYLLFAIDCRPFSDEDVELHLKYLSVCFSNFKHFNIPIFKLKYTVVLKLPRNQISDVCDSLNILKDIKCIILDFSFNWSTRIKYKCFSKARFLQSLTLNNNKISNVESYSFHGIIKLKFLSLTNNPIIHLDSHVLFLTSNLRSLNILNLNFKYIDPKAFDISNINIIVTKDHYICCIVHSGTLCTAFQPWFISCSDILPSLGMKIFYITLSVLIIVLNFLSVILQIVSYHKLRSNKTFSVIAITINANDILCAVCLSFVWIADLSFSDSFQAN